MSDTSPTDSTSSSDVTIPEASRSGTQSKLAKMIFPYSHSPWPAWSLSGLFLGTSMVGLSNPALPPFVMRFGFGCIFGGAGYIVSTGDVKNGSGITTAWSVIYLIANQLRKPGVLKREMPLGARTWPRHPLALAFTGATLLSTAVYGAEYFWFENF